MTTQGEAATPTRSRSTRTGVRGAVGVGLVLVLAGFLFAANARLSGGIADREAHDLLGLVQAEVERSEELATEVEDLRGEVDRLTDAGTAGLPVFDQAEQNRTELVAGRTPVVGPGLSVRLTDAPGNISRPEGVTNDMLVIHQQDLQAVINALWAGGAEAMTLQGERVISTSAFRCVGNVLLLHGRTYSPPYTVEAVGDPGRLRAALLDDRGVQSIIRASETIGLGFAVDEVEELELAGYQGSLELRHARVPESATVEENA